MASSPPDDRHAPRGAFPGDPAVFHSPYDDHDACGTGVIARQDGVPTREVVAVALEALTRVAHRGGAATDQSGDGAGLLVQLPHDFLRAVTPALDAHAGPVAVGMFFLPRDPADRDRASDLVEGVLLDDGLPFIGWRDVPVNPAALGPTAASAQPVIRQAFIGRPDGLPDDDAWERALYLARRDMEHRAVQEGLDGFYACSLSCRTVTYKALVNGRSLAAFYPDLADARFACAIAVFHERYATNTRPRWELAQPFRFLAHNGEINTLWGNRNAMAMRQGLLASRLFGEKMDRLRDVIVPGMSDSASLDNALELLLRTGRSPAHAVMMLVPQAWERFPDVEPAIKAFYEYHQCLIEPWDGPAALAYSDGIVAAVSLDRNGLRPCRYKVRDDGLVVAGSEVGLADIPAERVVESGKLGPGSLLLIDTARHVVMKSLEAKREVAARKPYGRWVARYMATLPPDVGTEPLIIDGGELRRRQVACGLTFEDVRLELESLAGAGIEATWSMGDDAPLPPLMATPPRVGGYLRQRFAQVTNPPMDALRESMVMSLRMHLGRRGSPLEERPAYARMLRIEHPVLLPREMAALRDLPRFPSLTLDATWPAAHGPGGLARALDTLCHAAERAARRGVHLLIVSDRAVGPERAPIPVLLALGAVRQHLVRTGLRAQVGLVAEAGDALEAHDLATLFGYGAEAVHPWLAMDAAAALFAEAPEHGRATDAPRPSPAEAQQKLRTALGKGLLKILAKMGISTLSSYCGSQAFDALGLGAEVVDRCFGGTVSPLGGVGFADLAADVLARHREAYGDVAPEALPDAGRARFRKEGEVHAWAPTVVTALQGSVGSGKGARAKVATGPEGHAAFVRTATAQPPLTVRDLIGFKAVPPVPLDQVEPMEAIRARFIVSAMSLGALSPEAHGALALAMNAIGARSNSGEGGEDPALYAPRADGQRADNRIKQVASGRFGVTAEYLARAEELEIKVVQGAKPGEGGQLPGHKVTALIARLRHATPGVPLISPPPHHDIYSIEDLAQLVHDLKAVNPRARVGVKLVAAAGVGTVAAGVAKAFADYVLISGHAGGTGAAALGSIKHAGSPWELGIAEAQRALVAQGMRHRVELRTDGGLRTGRDVMIAALLGAEAYGFGTAPLVALGCLMARQCHLNTCPTGVATQRDDLRAKFTGTPDHVVAWATQLAHEVRALLAQLGARTMDEVIGRADLLVQVERPESPRAAKLDLRAVLTPATGAESPRRTVERNARPGVELLDDTILAQVAPALERGEPAEGTWSIRNHHLSTGGRIAGWIAERHGNAGLPGAGLTLRFTGTAGQGFGAWAVRGMHLALEGDANDYVGKGLSGGTIAVRPAAGTRYAAAQHLNMLIGNTCLYGATSGRLYAAGGAGDRFAVRNSGAIAVVEGAGNHCCEYMTGGVVVVLAGTGRNFGAGMSNGLAYAMDEAGVLASRVNHEMVQLAAVDAEDEALLRLLIAEHVAMTGSPRGTTILEAWEAWVPRFRRLEPRGAAEPARAWRRALIEHGDAALHASPA
jgi:glutamate synthase (NADPH/NADH) large chain/glutamate synthase (ferredoxin)